MRKALIIAALAVIAASCSNAPTARISATIEGLADSTVILQKLNYNKLQAIDTIKTDAEGSFDYKVKLTGNAPYFYYIYSGESPVASLVLLDGDKVKVNIAKNGSFKVEGSQESEKLQQVNDAFSKVVSNMTSAIEALPENPTESEIKDLNKAVSRMYIDYKREAVKYVITNPFSITSAVVLFQKYNDGLKVFNEDSDAVIFRRTIDSLVTVYPKSDYILALRDEMSARESRMNINSRLDSAEQVSFPNLSMPDVNGEIKNLIDLEGKVIILSYWSAGQDDYKMFNQELVSLYNKYHSAGLEIYQIGLDIDKPSWASIVKQQKLPFINVNDGLGTMSPAVLTYYIDHIPAMLVIDRKGEVVARDQFEPAKLEALIKSKL
ncbi:MAG: DUF4369 domain-containing protein [Bacteroidales bacterium]|nr:DUF4369 domain-containing protein [Candidatus Cacconaster merdequi]